MRGLKNQLTKFTYSLETGEEDDQMRGLNNQLTKFTYFLETGEEDDQMRGLKTIDQVHVLPGDG